MLMMVFMFYRKYLFTIVHIIIVHWVQRIRYGEIIFNIVCHDSWETIKTTRDLNHHKYCWKWCWCFICCLQITYSCALFDVKSPKITILQLMPCLITVNVNLPCFCRLKYDSLIFFLANNVSGNVTWVT